ncbi:MAG: MBL fold metallo-hydrolase [Chloroflexi bacterium]|nr:MBL fold metallo-hydrolase [Chloroflexota bacterium]
MHRWTMEVLYDKGIYFPYLDLWMDATRVKDFALISHGHRDHTARHRRALATPETARILRAQERVRNIIELPYATPWEGDGYRLTLYPAGHCLGSAQILLELEDTGERVLYTGDFKLRANATTVPAPVVPCDVLIIDATYGHPRYTFPPDEEVIERLSALLQATLNDGAVPVVLAYALGKSQEALKLLLQRGFTVSVHPDIYRMALLYREAGVDFGGAFSCYTGQDLHGQVLLAPPHWRTSPEITRIPRRRSFLLSGWAIDPHTRFRYRVDDALPFSDHADFPSLVRYAEEAAPERIYTVFGFPNLSAHLRDLGFDAHHLAPQQMLPL